MTRPDQHPQLLAMGACEAACDVCMFQLFPNAKDDICDDCGLNPVRTPESAQQFITDAIDREAGMDLGELLIRNAIAQRPTAEQ